MEFLLSMSCNECNLNMKIKQVFHIELCTHMLGRHVHPQLQSHQPLLPSILLHPQFKSHQPLPVLKYLLFVLFQYHPSILLHPHVCTMCNGCGVVTDDQRRLYLASLAIFFIKMSYFQN